MSAPRGYPEAVIRPAAGERVLRVERVAPGAELAEFVDYYWLVRWRAPEAHQQQVVPQPRVHMAAEAGRLLVHGVTRGAFLRTLTGTGHVLGAAFHPGGFRPLLGRTVGSISETVRPAGELWHADDEPVAARILGTGETTVMVAALEDYLRALDPEPDATAREVTALVEQARERGEITRVEQLAGRAGLSTRSLQRLFTEYVGIGPKWIIQRFRILDAVAAAHSGEPIRWAELAEDLGFSDQSHLTRAFTQVVGTPPATYLRDPGTA